MPKKPAHLAPHACYVCGDIAERHDGNGHVFFSNAAADAELAAQCRTVSDVEARYVEEYRPY